MLWMLGIAAAIHGVKLVLRLVPDHVAEMWRALPFRVPARFETLLVGMATLILVMEPVHMANPVDADDVLGPWSARLPYTGLAALTAGLLTGVLDRAGPLGTGLMMAWPSAFYAAMAWAFFLLLRSWVPVGDAAVATELVAHAAPFLTLVTAFPVAALACGIVGATLGRLFHR